MPQGGITRGVFGEEQGDHYSWNRVSDQKAVGGKVRKVVRPDHGGHDEDFYFE